MQIFLHLYSTIEARLCFNNNYFLTLPKQTKTLIKIEMQDSLLIEFTPINNNSYSSFLCSIKQNFGNLECESPNINIIKLNQNNFYIIFSPNKQSTINILNNASQELTCRGKKIIYSSGVLQIIDKNKERIYNIANTNAKYKLSEQNGVILLFFSSEGQNSLHAFSLTTFNHIFINCEQYQVKENQLQCITNLHTFAKHKKITCFDAVTLNKITEYTAYKTEPNLNLPKKIIPYAFMQCIKVQDYTLAQKFLDEQIYIGKLTKSKIQGFFENFFMVTTPQIKKPEGTICLVYKDDKNKFFTSKYYTFELNTNNKIQNIKHCD